MKQKKAWSYIVIGLLLISVSLLFYFNVQQSFFPGELGYINYAEQDSSFSNSVRTDLDSACSYGTVKRYEINTLLWKFYDNPTQTTELFKEVEKGYFELIIQPSYEC